jgi:hypothetical protein
MIGTSGYSMHKEGVTDRRKYSRYQEASMYNVWNKEYKEEEWKSKHVDSNGQDESRRIYNDQ